MVLANSFLLKGAFSISIDLEMAWGVADHLTPDEKKRCAELERPICRRLLELLLKYKISATWATVGRLIEKREGHDFGSDWIWYAPDLVKEIAQAPVYQEIATHSCEHIYFFENTDERVRLDLESAKEIHRRFGYEFQSLVFPRNQVDKIDILKDVGLKIYRSTDIGWFQFLKVFGKTAHRWANLVDKMLPIPAPAVLPVRHSSGVIDFPSSLLLMGRNGIRKMVLPKVILYKAKKGLEEAAYQKKIFHIWFHPSNFYYETDRQFEVLEQILAEFQKFRSEDELVSMTMGQVADQCRAFSSPPQ